MDAAAAVAAASPIIFKVGGAWYFDPVSRAKAAEYGLKAYPFYFAGRSGVIGDIGAANVVAAIPFFEPGLVTKQWGTATAERSPSELGRAAADALAEWGRAKFAGIDSAGRTAELGRRIVDGGGRPSVAPSSRRGGRCRSPTTPPPRWRSPSRACGSCGATPTSSPARCWA